MLQGPLSDIAKVVLSIETVSFEKHVQDKIDESASLFSDSPAYHTPGPESTSTIPANLKGPFFPKEFSRAAVYGCVVSIGQGRSGVRWDVVQLLLQMLEFDLTPALSSVKSIGKELVKFLTGFNVPSYCNDCLVESEAGFMSFGLTPITLSTHEALVLERGHFYFTGISSLLTLAANNVFQMVDVVAAMSAEATGLSSNSFDATQYETHRPHRGMINCATKMRQLLDGSQRLNAVDGPITPSFLSIPAIHGPAQEHLASATK